ncbi:MAG: glycoside hydrolase [Luteolibacter sp.]|uniref:glycoside hydrolase n=1 Tax=Luteolibacter sp. TaxID=1962973 RepID=UPI003267DB0E
MKSTPSLLRLFSGIFAALLLVAHAADVPAPLEVKVDPAVSHGTWEGWGTSLCWMGNVFGDRDDLADFLFTTKTVTLAGKEVPGLGMNIVRYNAGACSTATIGDRKMAVSKIIEKYRQMDGFWLDGKDPDPTSASWDWNVDAKQRAMLLKARDRGADHFELFSNSPMWWMCANDNPSGAPDGDDDNLPEKNYPAFATYLAAVAKISKEKWGVTFTSIDPFNEPSTSYWFANCKQEGCHFSPASQEKFLPVLRAELDRHKLKELPIAASDETWYDSAIATWKSFSPATKALVPQVNVHGYQNGNGDRAGLHQLVVKEDGKRLWNSEYGDGDPGGLELARNFHRDMAALHPTAWCYWQPTDGSGWGLLACNMRRAEIRFANPKAAVLAQYSRHIRPGMVILETGRNTVVAAFSEKDKRLVLAILNDGPARPAHFDLTMFDVPDGQVSSTLTSPRAMARYEKQADLRIRDHHFEAVLPANSVQTFEINGLAPAE